MERAILHCDMNNFFASVEVKLDPTLKSKAVAVCGDEKERHGIILARNYLAKSFGVTVGEPIWQAKKKCKDLVLINGPHYDEYEKNSKQAREIYRRYTDIVEPFGIDECWLDITNSLKLFGSPRKIADEIRETIKKELDLTISVGVSYNKVFAKLGSDLKKPDATTEITKDNFKTIVWPLKTTDMIGIGHRTKEVLDKYFIYTLGDLANEKIEHIEYMLGTNGVRLWECANGLDDEPVVPYEELDEVKSISHGLTTVKDLKDNDEVWRLMIELTQEIAMKLREKGLRTSCISVSVRDAELLWVQFQKKTSISMQSSVDIAKFAFKLFKERYDFRKPIHTLTISATNLIEEGTPEQIGIFDDFDRKTRIENLERCMEDINFRYGEEVVKNGGIFENELLPKARRKVKFEDKT